MILTSASTAASLEKRHRDANVAGGATNGRTRGIDMAELREVGKGLRFPEGPIAMADGSVIVVEIQSGTLARVTPDGTVTEVAKTGGGPNGAAVGPDGKIYVCN